MQRESKKSTRVWEKIGLSYALDRKCFARGKGFRSRAATARAAAGGECVTRARGRLPICGPVQSLAQLWTLFSPCPVAVHVWSLTLAPRTGEKGTVCLAGMVALFTFCCNVAYLCLIHHPLSWEDALLSLLLLASPASSSPFSVYSCPRHIHLHVFQAASPFAPCHASVLAGCLCIIIPFSWQVFQLVLV